MLDSTPALPMSGMSAESAGAQPDSAVRVQTSRGPRQADDGEKSDAGRINTPDPQQAPPGGDEEDAGSGAASPGTTDRPSTAPDAGITTNPANPNSPTDPVDPVDPVDPTTPEPTAPASMSVDPECTRDALRIKASAYLDAQTAGDTSSLRLHASVRYTENGQEQQLGGGVWLRAAQVDFARHVLDEVRCSSVTHAVLSSLTGAVVLGVRLLYRAGELLEVEANVVPETLARIDVNAIIPVGNDRFVEPVVEARRMSREQLETYAERYFESAVNGDVPPSTPECRRLQNGLPLGGGLCTNAPGSMRFEQRRYPVLDEATGIATAAVLYDGHLGFYLIKMAGDELQDIVVIGGASTQSSGW
jgi:hypothetical protein